MCLYLQDVLETKLERKRKNQFGAPVGKKMVVFVDDLNMPQPGILSMLSTCECQVRSLLFRNLYPEVFGAQPPIELLRQCLDSHGFYDRKKLFWNKITDVLFVAACGPPGGGRNMVFIYLFYKMKIIVLMLLVV